MTMTVPQITSDDSKSSNTVNKMVRIKPNCLKMVRVNPNYKKMVRVKSNYKIIVRVKLHYLEPI
jgi:hypothetical protein